MPSEFHKSDTSEPSTPSRKIPSGLSDWRNAVIIGTIIGGSILIGFALNKQPQVANNTSNVVNTNQSSNSSQSNTNLDNNVSKSVPNQSSNTNNSQLSPEEIVKDYYRKIANSQYEEAWNFLPVELQEDKQVHPYGYNSFLKWYKDSINFVNIQDISLADSSNGLGTVNFKSIYHLKSGRKAPINLRFYMVLNQKNQRWYINKIKVIK